MLIPLPRSPAPSGSVLRLNRLFLGDGTFCDWFVSGNRIEEQLCSCSRWTESLQAKVTIGRLANWIVDATDDSFDFENFFGDFTGHDVSVVAIGHCGKGIGILNAGAD